MRLFALATAVIAAVSTVAWVRFRHQHIEYVSTNYGSLLEDEDGLPPLFI